MTASLSLVGMDTSQGEGLVCCVSNRPRYWPSLMRMKWLSKRFASRKARQLSGNLLQQTWALATGLKDGIVCTSSSTVLCRIICVLLSAGRRYTQKLKCYSSSVCIRNKAPSYVTKRQNHMDLEVTFFTLESVNPHLADVGNPLA
jgi:hypothetical protein